MLPTTSCYGPWPRASHHRFDDTPARQAPLQAGPDDAVGFLVLYFTGCFLRHRHGGRGEISIEHCGDFDTRQRSALRLWRMAHWIITFLGQDWLLVRWERSIILGPLRFDRCNTFLWRRRRTRSWCVMFPCAPRHLEGGPYVCGPPEI